MVVAVCAIACMFFNSENVTIRCDYGPTDILGGYLPAGDIVHVMAIQPNGKYETVAKNVLVTALGRWEQESGSSVCYIDLRMSMIQKWRVEGYSNYRIDFPLPD